MYKYVFPVIVSLLAVGCSSDTVIEEEKPIVETGDLMRFTGVADEGDTHTRAASLTSDFLVSTYKAFDLANQQTVMENYRVDYLLTGNAWDGIVRPHWDYTKVPGQYERYWDYSGFPYRFHAIAPCPANPAGYVLADKNLTIPAPYSAQTCTNGIKTPADKVAEPYLLAQVSRDNEGKDTDLLATNPDKRNINTASTQKHREVWLPFHHLNSKVRFGLYTTDLWVTEEGNYLCLQDLEITIHSNEPSGFVKGAGGYHASSADNWYIGAGNSGFTDLQRTTSSYTLLTYKGGSITDENNLANHLGKRSAFWLGSPEGLMQIPQENVSITVSFKLLDKNGQVYKSFQNCVVRMEDTGNSIFQWQSGYIYTYYLILDMLGHLEITFTATITPWEDVIGSLSTDLEQ